MAKGSKYATDANPLDTTSPWKATFGCDADKRLRDLGFEILERKGNLPPVWRKRIRGKWVRFSQEMATRYADNRKGGLET